MKSSDKQKNVDGQLARERAGIVLYERKTIKIHSADLHFDLTVSHLAIEWRISTENNKKKQQDEKQFFNAFLACNLQVKTICEEWYEKKGNKSISDQLEILLDSIQPFSLSSMT